MINKSTKNALYAKILMESSALLIEEEKKIEDEIHVANPKDENEIRGKYKNIILNFQRIRNNAFIMLLRNGNRFYTDADSWKSGKKLFLSVNNEIYELDMQSAKTLLAGDTEKIMDKSFSADKINNEINLLRAEHFNFEDYKDDAGSVPVISEKKEPMKQDFIKPDKDTEGKQSKKKETQKRLTERKLDNKVPEKEILQVKKESENAIPIVIANYDLDEFFMDEEESPVKTSSVRENNLDTKEDLKEVIKQNDEVKKEDLNEIKLLNDTEAVRIDNSQNEELVESVSVEELIMDTYIIRLKNAEDNKEKTFTIIVAPMKNTLETDAAFAPTFCFAKTGREVCNGASPNLQRLSYQIGIGGEGFMVRGSWNENGFTSLLYPQNMSEHNMSVTKKQIKPLKAHNIGHNISQMENGIRIHVLPLSSKNSSNSRVGILACLEDPIENTFISACTKDASYIDINYNNRIYRISAKWENKKLVSLIQMI